MLYDVILYTHATSLYTEREKDTKRYRLYTLLVGASASTILQPTWHSNIFPELLHLSGQMSQHCLCTVLLATARATLAFLQGLIELLASSLNEACGIHFCAWLDILDQPLHIYTIPCICVMCKNHQVLESGHHHNVHGGHHIYDEIDYYPAAQPLSPRRNDKLRCKNCNGKFQHKNTTHGSLGGYFATNQVQYKSASHTRHTHTTFSSSLKRVCALKVPEISEVSKDHFSTTTSAAFSRVEGDWVNFGVSVGWTLSFHVKGSRKMWPSYLLLWQSRNPFIQNAWRSRNMEPFLRNPKCNNKRNPIPRTTRTMKGRKGKFPWLRASNYRQLPHKACFCKTHILRKKINGEKLRDRHFPRTKKKSSPDPVAMFTAFLWNLIPRLTQWLYKFVQ